MAACFPNCLPNYATAKARNAPLRLALASLRGAALDAAHVAPVHPAATERRLKSITLGLNRMAAVSRAVKAFTPKQG